MNQAMARVSALLAICVVFCSIAGAHAQNDDLLAKAVAEIKSPKQLASEREAARIARDKALAALAQANETIEDGDYRLVNERILGLDVETFRKAYRADARLRKAILDIERLERLRDHPETRGNEPAGLDIPALIAAHSTTIRNVIRPPELVKKIEASDPAAGKEVENFVKLLRRKPTKPSTAADRLAIYLLNVETGEVLLAADEPDPGLTYCGSPEWSVDGTRILFDAIPAPGNRFSESRLKALEMVDGKLNLADLGPGNCPTGTPEGSAVVFLLNPNAVPGSEPGVYSMKADGADRNALCEYGRPLMSPDGKRVLVASFGGIKTLKFLDVDTGDFREVELPGYRVTTLPVWVSPSSFVAMIESAMGNAIALITTKAFEPLKIESILWKQDMSNELFASFATYSAATGRCVFVGVSPNGRALYSVMRDSPEAPKRLETGPFDNVLSTLAFSPDGKYLLFCSDRPGEIKKKP